MNAALEFILCMFDAWLDVFTLGGWSRWQGSKVPQIRVKKQS